MKKYKRIKVAVLLSLGLGLCTPAVTMAMLPQGGVIAGGSGNISKSDNVMNVVQQTQNLFINWDSFSVAKGEEVKFTGPQNFAVLNRVVGHDESKIYGEINAANHGNVYLINPNGILIGEGAVINTGSFIASTKDVIDVPSFINSGKVNFQVDAQGNIINLGSIKADYIEMHGDTISFKAADVDANFNASSITIDAKAVHAGFKEIEDGESGDIDETLAEAVNTKLGVEADVYLLKDSMADIRAELRGSGHYMLAKNDTKIESWDGGNAPYMSSEDAIDGLGYTVANKTIQGKDGKVGTGIFKYISGNAKVDNFTFENITVNGNIKNSGVGTLAGYLFGDGVRIANVTVSNGHVTGYNKVGGLVGASSSLVNGNTFLNVHNVDTTVTGRVEKDSTGNYTGIGIGGIIGYQESQTNREGKTNIFRNVSNSGTITGRLYVGGLAGRLTTADMDEVRNTGRIKQETVGEWKTYGNYSWLSYQNSYYIGGIAGAIGPTTEAAKGVRIRNAYNGGTIGVDTGTGTEYYDDGEYIGGIVGMLSGGDDDHIYGAQDSVIEYAHNTGTVTTGYRFVGGIVGYATGLGMAHTNNASDMIIRYSFNDGSILANYGGGLAGTFGGTIEQSYNNGGFSKSGYSGGLVYATESTLSNDIVIRDSYNTKNGTAHVGGILGNNYTYGSMTLERVWNEADIDVNTSYCGGIIGDLQNCSSVTLNQVYNFGNVQGGGTIGGLIGHNQAGSNADVTIKNSANYGNILAGNGSTAGGIIGNCTTSRDHYTAIENTVNFGNVSGTYDIGGIIGEYHHLENGKLSIKDSYNYGTVTATEGKTGGGMIGDLDWGYVLSKLKDVNFNNSGTVGDIAVGAVGYYDDNNKHKEEFVGNFDAKTNLKDIPNQTTYANAQFLSWKNVTTVDTEGKLGTETRKYPDGGYVWKMYETGEKDSDGNALFHKPLLTAFQTKVATQKNSVETKANDVSGALYDVTLPDGQLIQGVDWQRVLDLQNQFTSVNNRGDYTASAAEKGGSVPDHLYGYYNSSQQGLNIFITPGTVKPDESPTPDKPVLPEREVSRNDYLYSDEHDTGDGKLNWYMHMPPVIFIQEAGVQIGNVMKERF